MNKYDIENPWNNFQKCVYVNFVEICHYLGIYSSQRDKMGQNGDILKTMYNLKKTGMKSIWLEIIRWYLIQFYVNITFKDLIENSCHSVPFHHSGSYKSLELSTHFRFSLLHCQIFRVNCEEKKPFMGFVWLYSLSELCFIWMEV